MLLTPMRATVPLWLDSPTLITLLEESLMLLYVRLTTRIICLMKTTLHLRGHEVMPQEKLRLLGTTYPLCSNKHSRIRGVLTQVHESLVHHR